MKSKNSKQQQNRLLEPCLGRTKKACPPIET